MDFMPRRSIAIFARTWMSVRGKMIHAIQQKSRILEVSALTRSEVIGVNATVHSLSSVEFRRADYVSNRTQRGVR